MTERLFDSYETSLKKRHCLILALKESWLPLLGVPVFGIPSGALLWYGIAARDYKAIIVGSVFAIAVPFSLYMFTGFFRSTFQDLLIKELGVQGTGKILAIEEEKDTSTDERTHITTSHIFYNVTFEYEFDDKKYTAVHFLDNESLAPLLSVGDIVPVMILSCKPEQALIKERGLMRKLRKRSEKIETAKF
jgi:hypothetical protein